MPALLLLLLSLQTAREEITVTARVPEPRDEAIAASSVVTKKEIEAMPAAALPEIVQRVPGVTMFFDSDWSYGQPMVTARGFFGGGVVEYVKVLVDGVPVADAESGLADWRHLRAANIERVEVLRGPASPLYGDTAFGGVIDVITRPADSGNAANALVSAGSFGTHAVDASARLANRAKLSFFDATTDGYRVHSANDDRGADLALEQLGDAARLGLALSYAHKDRDDPGAITDDLDRRAANPFFLHDNERTTRRRAALSGEHFGDTPLRAVLYAADRDTGWTSTYQVAPKFGSTLVRRIATRSLGGSVDAAHDFGRLTLRGGVEGGRDTLDGNYAPVNGAVIASEDVARNRRAAFGTAAFRIAPSVQLVAGVRRDSIDSMSATSPRAGINVHAAGIVWFAQASRAFKAPTLDQLFDPRPFPGPTGKPIYISNSALLPQRARNFEIGASRATASANWSIAAYSMHVKDEIDLDLRTFSYRNIGASRHRGVESMFELTSARVRPFATYAWTRVEDEANPGQQLKNIPEHVAQLGLTTTLPARVEGSVVWRWMHGRWLDDDGLYPMPDVSRIDLRLARRIGPATLRLDVLNATNARYNELGYVLFGTPFEYPAAARAFRVGLGAAF
ncbi:MAG TPA: TonB-dependent receptor [Thermoanaerobaculia bacterium]|nr:TonB-dependent receptor [Thermoanaerobaculia bacterium]